MLRSIIIDDDKMSRVALKKVLEKHCANVEVISMADSVKSSINDIRNNQPDLVFLDVEMPDGTGFEVLEAFPEIKFETIFVTAHDHYAFKAIKFSALDYLLKPINIEEVKAAVEKVEKKHDRQLDRKNLKMLIRNLEDENNYLKNIALPTMEGLIVVELAGVIHCEANINYCTVYMKDGEKIVVSRTLKEFEELLSENNFCRIHQSHLVNLDQLSKYVKGKGGYVVMKDGTQLEVSMRKKDTLLKNLAHL